MSQGSSLTRIVGTGISETITGGAASELLIGLAGDDTIAAEKGGDVIFGDYAETNLLQGGETATSFAQYGETGAWAVQDEPGGHTSMTQSVYTLAGETYALSFDIAANYGAGSLSGAVEVLWNGVVIDSFDTNSATFSAHEVTFEGIDGVGDLTFRSIDGPEDTGPAINTDGPIFHYDADMLIGGETVTVKAFAEGQSNIYQVLNGELNVFDPATETYTKAGAPATVVANAIGFNVEDDMIYGIAVKDGVDSRGVTVSQSDLVMYDATGASFVVGSTPYRSWTGDFDDQGNLWAFHSSFDRVTKIDVDQVDANGEVSATTFKMPKEMVTDNLWDVAFNAETQCFSGVTRPRAEGEPGYLYLFDISAVATGGEPTFTKTAITGTVIDGETSEGMPYITFGATIYDADGNLYVAGNGGDHDMNDATATAGGIYRVEIDPATGEAQLVLLADAPKSYSNDGAADPRAIDPFTEVDQYATVLIRQPNVVQQPDPENTFDDLIDAGAGADEAHGGIGDDIVSGQSGDDMLTGGVGEDRLYGGKSDGAPTTVRSDYYDDDGVRYDANGTIIPSDDDTLLGGEGADYLHGSSGNDRLDGGADNDELDGGSGHDILLGGDGDDLLSGGAENDKLNGGDGADQLIGGSGDDQLTGGAGADDLRGGSGVDVLDGGAGDDSLDGGVGDDELIGGAGNDVLKGSTGDDTLSDSFGDNTLEGGSGNDKLTGGVGVDLLNGGSGDDVLSGGGAADVLKGGSGDDTLSGGGDRDKLYGGKGDDVIDGGSGSDYINASSGDDVINGGAGKDKIFLGAGSDIVTGGLGNDKFVFRAEDLDGSTDIITDFTFGGGEADRLDLRLLDLSSGGVAVDDWFAQNVVQNADNSVTVSLDYLTINLIDHDGLGDGFLTDVQDGLLF